MIKRGKKEFKVDLIISADWHLMEKESKSPCRLDSIWDAQWDKVKQIEKIGRQHECPIFIAGDIFEHWKTSPQLINYCMALFPPQIYSIVGNHDMPQHNIELMEKSGFETLMRSGMIEPFFASQGDWNADFKKIKPFWFKDKKINIAHIMTWQGEEPWPGCTDPEADKMFKMFPEANLIITGHNHKTFTAKKGNRLLINPGSLTRHKADQADHKPCVFLWNAESNTFKIHYLKIKPGVISREHIETKKKKDERNEAFIKKLAQGWDLSLSFEDNLEKAFQENETPEKVKQTIYQWMEK